MQAIDYQLEQERIARRRKIAEALLAQSQLPIGGTDTVGGIAVRRSPLEGVAKVAQAYAGVSQQNKADDEAKALGQRQRDEVAAALNEYQRAVTPRPAGFEHIVDEQANGGEGASATIETPGYTPTPEAKKTAAFKLMGAGGGSVTDIPKLIVAQALKEGDYAKIDPKDYTAESLRKYQASGNVADLVPVRKMEVAGTGGSSRVYDPYAVKPGEIFDHTAPPAGPTNIARLQAERAALAAANPADPRIKELDAAITKETTHRPANVVNVDARTGEKYGAAFAGKVADQDVALLDAARKAPELATRANQVKEVLASGKVITGTGADYRLALGKALNLAGAGDAETIANTETLSVNLARNTLDAIKASGLGSGSGFSNADRDFLEKAAGGKITLEATTISRLAELSHRAADLSAQAWNKRVKDIPDSALNGTGIKRDPVTVSPLFSGAKPAGPKLSPEAQRYIDAARSGGGQ